MHGTPYGGRGLAEGRRSSPRVRSRSNGFSSRVGRSLRAAGRKLAEWGRCVACIIHRCRESQRGIAPTAELVYTWGVDYDTAFECLPPLMSVIVMLIKYLNGVFRVKKLREVCETIKSDTERLFDLSEYEVLHLYAMEGRRFLISFIVAIGILVVIYLILPTTLIVNDLITKNASEDRYLMYPGRYFVVNIQEYYYIATLHSYLASLMIPLILTSVDSMYITFTQHACAMYAVVGYRLKTVHILNPDALRKEFGEIKYKKLLVDKQERMYEKLVLCVKEHQKVLECTNIVQSAFSAPLLFQIMINIVLLSITGVQTLLRLSQRRFTDVARMVTWMAGDHIHLFFLYLPGQRILDFSTQLYFDALECMWYTSSKKSQGIYQFMVMSSESPVKFTALKVAPLNMEAFLSVTQAAVSYFTVLSSTL